MKQQTRVAEGDSALEYPSTDEFIADWGPLFDQMSGPELRRLYDAGFVRNDSTDRFPDVETLLDFLDDYPFCHVSGKIKGDPNGNDPEIYVKYVGYSPEEALSADITRDDVDDVEFRRSFLSTFCEASWITLDGEELSAGYQ
jgi:hypothetical protein